MLNQSRGLLPVKVASSLDKELAEMAHDRRVVVSEVSSAIDLVQGLLHLTSHLHLECRIFHSLLLLIFCWHWTVYCGCSNLAVHLRVLVEALATMS